MTESRKVPGSGEATHEEVLGFCDRVKELIIDPASINEESEYLQSVYDNSDGERIRVAMARSGEGLYNDELALGLYEVSIYAASPLENGNTMIVTRTYRVEPFSTTNRPVVSFEHKTSEIDTATGKEVTTDTKQNLRDAMRKERFDEVQGALDIQAAIGATGVLTSTLCAEVLEKLDGLSPNDLITT